MHQEMTKIHIETPGQGLTDITDDVRRWVAMTKIQTGILTLFCQHTSASLTIQENADPDVLTDLRDFFSGLVRESTTAYRHNSEGSDDMPAHIKSALTDVSLTIPVSEGRPALGTWQGIYLFEHRTRSHRRTVVIHLLGQ